MANPNAVFKAKAPVLMARLMADIPQWGVLDAAAAAGNAGGESAGFTKLQETHPTVKGSRGGFGWFQWTAKRRRAYEGWCTRNGLDPSDDEANIRYVIVELKGPEKATVPAVKKAKGLDSKVLAFCKAFERPGVPHVSARQEWARRALDAWNASPYAKQSGKVEADAPASDAKPAPRTDTVTVKIVQQHLLELGYTEVGGVDGHIGPMTETAVLAFRHDNGLPLTTAIDDDLLKALDGAKPRKLVGAREEAKPDEVREVVPEVRSNWLTKIGALVVGIPAAASGLFDGVLGNLGVATGYIQPVKDFVGDMPGWVWFAAIAVSAAGLYLVARHGERKGVEAFQSGARR